MIIVREATGRDAEAMSRILTTFLTLSGSNRPGSPNHVLNFYINHPDQISCYVAQDERGTLQGFQSLKIATEGNPYEVTCGWGVIGTYVADDAARKGVGRALFGATLNAARHAGLAYIDATIGAANQAALAYYETMGFVTYKRIGTAYCKRLDVAANTD